MASERRPPSGTESVPVHDHIRDFWDADAATYDRSASHGLTDPVEAAAWRAALRRHLPPPPARVLDVGAGTGALSLLAAELGYTVTALDISAGMLAHATRKAAERGLDIATFVGPAEDPPEGPFDAVIERHVTWTLPDPADALARWRAVAPAGRLVLYEPHWDRGRLVPRARYALADAIRAVLRTASDHHAEYDPAVRDALPLADRVSPDNLIPLVVASGWQAPRIERLRDVEWAGLRRGGSLVAWLEARPRFALIADA